MFASNSFDHAKVYVNLGLFLVPCGRLDRLVCCVYFTFFRSNMSVILCIIVFTSLFTYVATCVFARKKMLKRNEVHSSSYQESRRNFLGFLRELNMAKTYVLVVSFCFLCYLHIYQPLLSILNRGDKTPDSVVNAIDCWIATLELCNCFQGKQRNE